MKKYSQIFLFVVLLFALFLNLSCKKTPVGPPPSPANDTTSHAFTFQQFTWGGGGASSINDVAILSDTNIWCVGEIQLVEYDSTGRQIYTPYGVAHWDGKNWKPLRLFDNLYNLSVAPIQGIFISSPNDIWLAGGSIFHWDGISTQAQVSLSRLDLPNSNTMIKKTWGSSSSNLYGIGTGGTIVHFDGSNWQKLSSPTQLDIMDIYGATDPRTGQLEVLAIASQYNSLPFQTQILSIQGTSVTQVGPTIPDWYFSLWFVPGEKYYLVGDGIRSTSSLSDTSWSNNTIGTITRYSSTCIRGPNLNDLFVVGSFFDVAHYNGSTWYNYQNELPYGDGDFGCVALKGNTMIAGGQTGQNAIIVMGKR